MRDFGTPTNDHFANVGPRNADILIWVEARDRQSGAPVGVGLWTGPEQRDFTINGETRTYYGNNAILQPPVIRRGAGLSVRIIRFVLSRVHPAVVNLLDTLDPRNRPLQIHRAVFNPTTGVLIDEPHVIFDGEFDEPDASASMGAPNQVTCRAAPRTQQLTVTLPLNLSAETGKLANPNDALLKRAAIAGNSTVWWGSKRLVDDTAGE